MAPRKWSNLAFGKFCAFPEFIPFQMNLPSENTLVNKEGGISFEHYADSGPAGPLGKMFVNPHYIQGKSEAFDFSYNSNDLKYNFQGKLELKKKLLMEKLNIEHEVSGRPVGILVAADFPLANPAGFEALELAVRTAEGKMQGGFRTKVNRSLVMENPTLEFGYQITDTVKAGVQFGINQKDLKSSDIELRVAAREAGFLGTGHVVLKASKFSAATFTVQAPKFNVNGKQVVVTKQLKTDGKTLLEAKAVAEVKVCNGLNLKFKASHTAAGDLLTASAIIPQLPGAYDLTVGATYNNKTGGLKYGMLLQHGYYSFVGW